jgi:hypothetical protein
MGGGEISTKRVHFVKQTLTYREKKKYLSEAGGDF